MKVLVTGASGFLGSHVVEWLRENGHTPRALVRPTSDVRHLIEAGVELAVGAVERKDTLPDAVRGVDAIVHAAGLVKARNRDEFERVNLGGTRNLLEAAREYSPDLRRFVFVGSQAAFGPSETPIGEDDCLPNPVTTYGKTKLAGERAVLEYADRFPVTALRPCALYGPRDREILAVFWWVSRGFMPVMGSGRTRASMLHGADCATAVGAALTREHPSGRTYFVDDGKAYTYLDIIRVVGEAAGKKPVTLRIPPAIVAVVAAVLEGLGKITRRPVMLTREKVREMMQPAYVYDASRITNELGWRPAIEFPRGVADTMSWYRSHGWL